MYHFAKYGSAANMLILLEPVLSSILMSIFDFVPIPELIVYCYI
jgi:hypothetical protein